MADSNKLKYYILADHTDFEKGMKKVVSAAKTGGKAIGVGIAAGAVAGTAAIAGMTKVMSEAIELAKVQEEAEAKLGAVLEATGNAAGYNLEQLKAMAGAMQGVTTVGDETIIAGQAILATFKEIKGEAFEGATKAALDMSAVMDQDLKSSMVQIGKALNDPIKGLTALSRVGVSFTDEQKEQIKVLQESGDIMGAQAVILRELQSEFGGAAAALRDTFGGAVTAASNAFGDLQEQIGFTITKNQFFVESAKIAEQVFIDWTGSIQENQQAMNDLAKNIGLNLVGSIGAAVEVVGFFHTSWLKLETAIPVIVDAFQFGGNAIFNILRGMLLPLDGIFQGVEKIADFMGKDFVNPFDAIQGKINAFGEITQGVMEDNFQHIIDTENAYSTLGAKIDEIKLKMSGVGAVAVENSKDIKTANETIAASAEESDKKRVESGKSSNKKIKENTADLVDFWRVKHDEKYEVVSRSYDAIDQAEEDANAKHKAFADEFVNFSNSATSDVVAAFVQGEDTKVAVAGIASSYLEKYAIDAATKGLEPIFEALGSQVGAWVGLGTAQTSTEGDSWQQKLATGAGYLAAATAAIFGAKAVGNNMFAEGGWIGANPQGGYVSGGPPGIDTVFAGYTNGGAVRNWIGNGEFVMDAETTAANYDILEDMRMSKKRYNKFHADGGPIGDAWGVTRDINDSGFDTFWKSVFSNGFNWWGAVRDSVAYYAGTGAGMNGGKAVGKNLFNEGGVIGDRKFGFGGFFSDLLDPFDIVEKTNDLLDKVDPIGSKLRENVGGVNLGELWNMARDLPIVGETVERADKILYPFVRDTLTPGKYPDFTSAKDMLRGAYEGLGKELATWVAYAGLDPLGGVVGGMALGSYETGTDYVPKTGPYILHQGESVNTAKETSQKTDILEQMREELTSANLKIISLMRGQDKLLKKWDKLGLKVVSA